MQDIRIIPLPGPSDQRRLQPALQQHHSLGGIKPVGARLFSAALDRLRSDWQTRCGHPVPVVETFVDPEQFQATAYTAQGWKEPHFATHRQAQSETFDFIEAFHSRQRRHASLGGLSPADFELKRNY